MQPIFHSRPKIKLSTRVKGLFSASIPFENRVPSGNWSDYFGHYQNQRWGEWDSNSCWCLSVINTLEDQLEWLNKNGKFSQEAVDFFTKNGYIDADGDFSLSERFIEILGGLKMNGGTAPTAWELLKQYGAIPRDMLNFSLAEAQTCASESVFEQVYFSFPLYFDIEKAKALGQQFLQYVNITYQQIGSLWTTPDLVTLQTALRQAPLTIGISIPANVSLWNNTFVQYDGGKQPAHEIELYAIDDKGQYLIFDQYIPSLKVLSSNYYIPFCHQGVITAVDPQIKKNLNSLSQLLTALATILQKMLSSLKK